MRSVRSTGARSRSKPFFERASDRSDAALADRRAAVDAEDIAVIVYTSTTAGKPKGAMLLPRAIMAGRLSDLCWMADGLESTIEAASIIAV